MHADIELRVTCAVGHGPALSCANLHSISPRSVCANFHSVSPRSVCEFVNGILTFADGATHRRINVELGTN